VITLWENTVMSSFAAIERPDCSLPACHKLLQMELNPHLTPSERAAVAQYLIRHGQLWDREQEERNG
jgi:hypothetical protein